MNIALVFAGGVGKRINSKAKPKQFLEIYQKPIIVHTVEHFDNHPEIDAICIVCVADWVDYMERIVKKYDLRKVRWIIPGGKTALDSQYLGLKAISEEEGAEDAVVLIHDGVRPLINDKTISDCISSVKQYGSAVTVAMATETIIQKDEEGNVSITMPRSECMLARAPQCFVLKDIMDVHERSIENGNHTYIDSASMMLDYGFKVHTVLGPEENIKVTTPSDFYICRALLDAREESQLYGL